MGGAISMGTGIWSMHFIGMLAFRLPIPVSYDLDITMLSMAIAMAASVVARGAGIPDTASSIVRHDGARSFHA